MTKWSDNYLCAKRFRDSGTDGRREEMSAQTDKRNALESDFGRVIFSPACRRLHDKTQVFPLTTNDNIHSRLTHSLEVMNMGLSFSINLSQNNDFIKATGLKENEILRSIGATLKTSCLVHDIGNPPFGHFGETVFQNYFTQLFSDLSYIWHGITETNYLTKGERKSLGEDDRRELNEKRRNYIEEQLKYFLSREDWKLDYTEFDGNAEGLRVLTRLQNAGDLKGLNLTYATLASTIKYPNIGKSKSDHRIGNHKHGVFTTEQNVLEEISKACMLGSQGQFFRHPLAFLMEAADSICYLVMDIDDAITRKWVTFEEVNNLVYSSDQEAKESITNSYKGILAGNTSPRKRWMALRTAIIGYLMQVAVNNFVKNLSKIETGKYDYELIEDGCPLTELLKDFTKTRILSKRDINLLETTGKSVIIGLMDAYIQLMFHPDRGYRDRAKALLSKSTLMTVIDEHIRDHKEAYTDKYGTDDVDYVFERFDLADLTVEERLRILRDYVAGMTDKFALNHYRELSGQRLP